MNVDLLNEVALKNRGVVGGLKKGTMTFYDGNTVHMGNRCKLAPIGGWIFRWVSKHGRMDRGTLIIRPTTQDTRAVYREGIYNYVVGLLKSIAKTHSRSDLNESVVSDIVDSVIKADLHHRVDAIEVLYLCIHDKGLEACLIESDTGDDLLLDKLRANIKYYKSLVSRSTIKHSKKLVEAYISDK